MSKSSLEWAARVLAARGSVRSVLGDIETLSNIATANDLTAQLADPAVDLDGLDYQQGLLLAQVFSDFEAWLAEPVSAAPGAPTRRAVFYQV